MSKSVAPKRVSLEIASKLRLALRNGHARILFVVRVPRLYYEVELRTNSSQPSNPPRITS